MGFRNFPGIRYLYDIRERLEHIEDRVIEVNNTLDRSVSNKEYDRFDNLKKRNDSKKVQVGIYIHGGMGDYLINLNYIYFLGNKFDNGYINIDLYAPQHFNTACTLLECMSKKMISNVYKDVNQSTKNRYDLFIDLSRYPNVLTVNTRKLSELAPELLDYVMTIQKFKAHNERLFMYGGHMDGQGIELCILDGKKRITQPDIYGVLGITEKTGYQLDLDTERVCDKFGIHKKIITIHRGCDTAHAEYSTKLWPMEYYESLVRMLKEKYPETQIVQLGASKDRCPEIVGVDLNLVGKTSLVELASILKIASLHIDGEGGIVHLRHVVEGGKSVVLFGPTSARFYGYSNNINMVGDGCSTWCEWTTSTWQERCIRGEYQAPCMCSIIPEMVMKEIEEIM